MSKTFCSHFQCWGMVPVYRFSFWWYFINVLTWTIFWKNFFEDMSPFLWGHWYPCVGLPVMSALGFKARGGSLACMLPCLCTMDTSDSPLVWHLLTSWQPSWQPSHSLHVCSRGRMPGFDRATSRTVNRHVIHSVTATGYQQHKF